MPHTSQNIEVVTLFAHKIALAFFGVDSLRKTHCLDCSVAFGVL